MAILLNAVATYRPRIVLGKLADIDEVVRLILMKKSMNSGDLKMALDSLQDIVAYLLSLGRSVKLDGLFSYIPSIQLDGSIKVYHRIDKRLTTLLNAPYAFKGDVKNRDNIGKTPDDLVAIWNKVNPSDPITP